MDGTAKFLCKCAAPDLLSSIISGFCRSYFLGAKNSLDLFLSQVEQKTSIRELSNGHITDSLLFCLEFPTPNKLVHYFEI